VDDGLVARPVCTTQMPLISAVGRAQIRSSVLKLCSPWAKSWPALPRSGQPCFSSNAAARYRSRSESGQRQHAVVEPGRRVPASWSSAGGSRAAIACQRVWHAAPKDPAEQVRTGPHQARPRPGEPAHAVHMDRQVGGPHHIVVSLITITSQARRDRSRRAASRRSGRKGTPPALDASSLTVTGGRTAAAEVARLARRPGSGWEHMALSSSARTKTAAPIAFGGLERRATPHSSAASTGWTCGGRRPARRGGRVGAAIRRNTAGSPAVSRTWAIGNTAQRRCPARHAALCPTSRRAGRGRLTGWSATA